MIIFVSHVVFLKYLFFFEKLFSTCHNFILFYISSFLLFFFFFQYYGRGRIRDNSVMTVLTR